MITDNDPAGMGIAFTRAINRYSPHTCRLITTAEKYGFDFATDIHLPDIEDDDFGEVEQLLQDADLIHFHVLRDENSHLGPLVIRDYTAGKPILHHHHGHPDYLINVATYNEKYRRLQRRVIVSTPDLLQVAEDAVWVPNMVPLTDPLLLPRYDATLPRTGIKICQAPTRKFDKHSDEFRQVMKRLQQRHPQVETVMIEKTPYRQCLRIKRGCHVVFDHMRGWFGISSLESLSQGKPVLAGLDEWNQACIKRFTGADNLPWVVVQDAGQLETALDTLIVDADRRDAVGRASRRFMETYWTEQQILKVLFDVYEKL